jgi:hypothetical protein
VAIHDFAQSGKLGIFHRSLSCGKSVQIQPRGRECQTSLSNRQTDDLLRQIRRFSSQYVHIGSTFSYAISSESPSLTVYIGDRSCNISWDGDSNITEFIEAHKLGPLHHYDIEEWRSSVAVRDTGVLFVRSALRPSQKRALRKLAAENCGSISIGWMGLSESRDLLPELGVTEMELPVFAFTPRGNRCHFFAHNRTASLTRIGFFERARVGTAECDHATKKPLITPVVRSTPNGGVFLAVSFVIGIGVVGLLQIQTTREHKSE